MGQQCYFHKPLSMFVFCCMCVGVQDSASRPGGEDPSYSPECLQHGHQGGADTAKQYGARKRYGTNHHHHRRKMSSPSRSTLHHVYHMHEI